LDGKAGRVCCGSTEQEHYWIFQKVRDPWQKKDQPAADGNAEEMVPSHGAAMFVSHKELTVAAVEASGDGEGRSRARIVEPRSI
jgi:hypothetical protein